MSLQDINCVKHASCVFMIARKPLWTLRTGPLFLCLAALYVRSLQGNPRTNRSSGSGLKEHTCPWRRQWALFFATSAANRLAMFHPKGEGSNLSGRFFFFSSRCKTNTPPRFVTNGFPQNESKWWVLKKKNSGFKHGVILGIHSSKFKRKLHVFLWTHIPFAMSEAGICCSLARNYLISWWFQPTFEKICSAKWESFPQISEGEK